jgi:hypothetical protein
MHPAATARRPRNVYENNLTTAAFTTVAQRAVRGVAERRERHFFWQVKTAEPAVVLVWKVSR